MIAAAGMLLLMAAPQAQALETAAAETWVVSFGQQAPGTFFAPAGRKGLTAADRRVLRAEMLKTWDAGIARTRADIETRLRGGVKTGGIAIVQTWDHIPAMLVQATEDQARALESVKGVVSVRRQIQYKPLLTSALRFLKAQEFWSVHGDGKGVAVAVIDTGVRFLDDFFGDCEQPGDEGCSVVHEEVFAPVDGSAPATHGIVTSGIVHGIAPGADIISLDVFYYTGRPSPEDYVTDDNYILTALNWCIQNRDAYNIVSANMSLGSGGTGGFCDSYGDGIIDAISTLYAMDVMVSIASGNEGMGSGLSWPACAYPGVAVGACSDSGQNAGNAASFSNQASAVAMMAPGVSVTAGGIGGASGTSMAAPFVAGAMALWAADLQDQQYPGPLADAILRRLFMTAKPGTSAHSDYEWQWAVLQMNPVSAISEHQLVPTGQSVRINGGASKTWTVPVNEAAATGVEKMTIGIDLELSDTDDMEIVVTSPQGTVVSGNLPKGSSSSARIVLGSWYLPELSTAFLDENPNGNWYVTLNNNATGSRATILNLSVSMDTRGNDDLRLLDLRPLAQETDFAAHTFALEMDVYSMALTDMACTADVTMTGVNTGTASQGQDIPISVASGASSVIIPVPMPATLPNDTYTFTVAMHCGGGAVFPASLETSYDLAVQAISVQAGKLASSTALPDNKSISYSYQSSNNNPWPVSCTERVLREGGNAVLSQRDVELAAGNRTINGDIDVSGIWENGVKVEIRIGLECDFHEVTNTIPTLSFTMLEIPEATVEANPGLEGPAPFTVVLQADLVGIADQVKWTLGDGGTEIGETITHTYQNTGEYNVSLKVSNGAGFSTQRATVTVTEPKPEITPDTGSSGGGCSGAGMGSFFAVMALLAMMRRRRL